MSVLNRKSLRRWLVTAIGYLLVAGGLGSYKWLEIQASVAAFQSQPEFAEVVEVSEAKRSMFTQSVEAIGVAVAPQQVVLRNELPGHIVAVSFESGAMVRKGDVILQIDVSEEQANLEAQKARAELAESVLERNVALRGSKVVSQEDLDRARAELAVVRADIEATTSVIRKKTVVAPFAGVIGIHQFEVGQFLGANSIITTLVGKSDHTWVDFSLPQFYGELPIGTEVRVRVVRTNKSGEVFHGTIVAGDSTISTSSRSRLYRARVEAQLLHNASVEVTIPVTNHKALSEVTGIAVQTDSQGSYVWALDPAETEGSYRARRVNVSIEGRRDSLVYVKGDLPDGQAVAADGAFKVFEGLLVHGRGRYSKTVDESSGGS